MQAFTFSLRTSTKKETGNIPIFILTHWSMEANGKLTDFDWNGFKITSKKGSNLKTINANYVIISSRKQNYVINCWCRVNASTSGYYICLKFLNLEFFKLTLNWLNFRFFSNLTSSFQPTSFLLLIFSLVGLSFPRDKLSSISGLLFEITNKLHQIELLSTNKSISNQAKVFYPPKSRLNWHPKIKY